MTVEHEDTSATALPELMLTPSKLDPLTGSEEFRGVDATVLDFWRFALPDLRMNNARGYLAEFLVHKALGVDAVRVEWDVADVQWQGLNIEVKSGAYLQLWEQRAPSRISFDGLKSRIQLPSGGYSNERTYNADIYVFCVQTVRAHGEYNPLDISRWEFYVMPRTTLEELGYASIGLVTVQRIVEAVAFDGLAAKIDEARLALESPSPARLDTASQP